MHPSDREAHKLKIFGIGSLCGLGLVILGALLRYDISGFEALVIVLACGFGAVAIFKDR